VALPHTSEPLRGEWFLKGTEPKSLTQELAQVQARILAPANGTIIALDPDIPPARQRLVFEAQVVGSSLRWVLDGADVGMASTPLVWNPQPGLHTLSLLDDGQQTLDSVAFIVRGKKSKEDDM
jgi:penicillin-binding protein 1C